VELQEDEVPSVGDFELDFDLLWRGPLPSDQGTGVSPKYPYKQAMRSEFHHQLHALTQIPGVGLRCAPIAFCYPGQFVNGKLIPIPGAEPERRDLHHWRNDESWCYLVLGGQRYVPLLRPQDGMVCHLDITILTPPESINVPRRDTDNRLKVLRDALRIPQSEQEVGGYETITPEPCLCLFEDDGNENVGSVSSHTRPLLKPNPPGREAEVMVWIRCRLVSRGEAGF